VCLGFPRTDREVAWLSHAGRKCHACASLTLSDLRYLPHLHGPPLSRSPALPPRRAQVVCVCLAQPCCPPLPGSIRGPPLSRSPALPPCRAQVVCVCWNENHRKLTTSDQNGLIIVWMLHKGMWCVQNSRLCSSYHPSLLHSSHTPLLRPAGDDHRLDAAQGHVVSANPTGPPLYSSPRRMPPLTPLATLAFTTPS
jgi:hypothetical protein